MNSRFIIVVVLVLGGCTNFDQAFGGWVGFHVDELVAQWGPPAFAVLLRTDRGRGHGPLRSRRLRRRVHLLGFAVHAGHPPSTIRCQAALRLLLWRLLRHPGLLPAWGWPVGRVDLILSDLFWAALRCRP